MRYCGIDVSAKATNQQLCTLHERRGPEGMELVATFYEPGTVEGMSGPTVHGFGLGQAVVAVDAPSGHRLDLLGGGLAAAGGARVCPPAVTSACGCATPCCSAAACRCIPCRPQTSHTAPGRLDASASTVRQHSGLELNGRPPTRLSRGAWGRRADLRRLCETYPDAIFCALLGHRPGAKRTPSGLQERIAVLKLEGIVDADGGLWRRTLDGLDVRRGLRRVRARGRGRRAGSGPGEGVIVLPSLELRDRYEKLPAPSRQSLA